MSDSYSPLSPVIVRALLDKGFDKRRNAGYEVERLVKDFVVKDELEQVKDVINVLRNFVMSPNVHSRKGGLVGLGSVSLGLGPRVIDPFLKDILGIIFPSFNDQNSNVRFYATEALSNVCRISRASCLNMVNEIFCIILQLSMETEQNLKSATDVLDRVMKDLVAENPTFDLVSFISVMREKCMMRACTSQTPTQSMLVSWMACLQSAPQIDLLPFLPDLIDGLFLILESPKKEVKKMAETVIGQFIASMRRKPESVNYTQMINILIIHAQSTDPLVQRVSLRLMVAFVRLSGRAMVPFAAGILRSAMPCLALTDSSLIETRSLAEEVNNALLDLVSAQDDVKGIAMATIDTRGDDPDYFAADDEADKVDVPTMMEVIQTQLKMTPVPCKVAALRWMYHLNEKISVRMQAFVDPCFASLLPCVCDPADEVVLLALQVLAQISSSTFPDEEDSAVAAPIRVAKTADSKLGSEDLVVGRHFVRFLEGLLHLFQNERNILKSRGSFILRQLCVMLPADAIYRCLSELLMREDNLSFATVMVETLSAILLTAKELFDLRQQLKRLQSEESCDLFVKLYGCWCHSPVATLTLCLLCQCYDQAATLVHIIGDLDITTDSLVELDKLIQMLESPIFSSLRLQLLYPSDHKSLVEAMYGILMIIPQTDAFQMLRCRLNCVPPTHMASRPRQASPKSRRKNIDFSDLLRHFEATQRRHQSFRERALKQRMQSNMLASSSALSR